LGGKKLVVVVLKRVRKFEDFYEHDYSSSKSYDRLLNLFSHCLAHQYLLNMCSFMNNIWSLDRSEMEKGPVQFTKLFSGRQLCQSDIMTLLFVESNLLNFVIAKASG
jgi:hypothetical protein